MKINFLMKHRLYLAFTILAVGGCQNESIPKYEVEKGVSKALAISRSENIEEVAYHLYFNIPSELSESIGASIDISCNLKNSTEPLIIDFNEKEEKIKAITANGNKQEIIFKNGHLIIPSSELQNGKNDIHIEFVAGETSLNRSEEYLYTLLVPDRASTVFPCFDQPNIKAKFTLSLDVPKDWVAVGNGALNKQTTKAESTTYDFAATKPISTYLFAFAAGKFKVLEQERGGRPMKMYHRETDEAKINRNADAIFELHESALTWLENYTGIDYPFEKFDFVLIPSFQYGGMEHVGNIFYKASSLMLDESATDNQKLGRASLIAHETAHKWFGNLVTMDWFNDVWLKEVFANFMAAKIVNPNFPDINHDLRFLLAHHPSAYSEDRTEGSHPIQQNLENLKDAGTLYGRIIYQKAPVVMNQLETMIGEAAFQQGLQEYLRQFSYGNATWDDLITILDAKTQEDIKSWSEVWVKQSGMPRYETTLGENKISIAQQDDNGKVWSQQIEMVIQKGNKETIHPQIIKKTTDIALAEDWKNADFVIANGTELGYGYFALDKKSRDFLLGNISNIQNPVTRGAAWLALYEEMLHGKVQPHRLMVSIITAINVEQEPLNTQNILNQMQTIFWKFYRPNQREQMAVILEEKLLFAIMNTDNVSLKAAFFKAYQNIVTTNEGKAKLYAIWEGKEKIEGLTLSENDKTTLAYELALRLPPQAANIFATQRANIKNPDRQRRFDFVIQALSPEEAVRDTFFESLKLSENRHYEPWVVEAVEYLHHPLRARTAEKYILPSLELLEEIQTTGDIFFPKRWLNATFSGHQSVSAANTVRQFLKERPQYPYRLKNKILQAADLTFRTAG